MSAPYYGDLPQDPQDAAKDARMGPTGITRLQAEDYYEKGEPLPVIADYGETSKMEDAK